MNMSTTNQNLEKIYQNILDNLSLREQIRLAALILNNISRKNVAVIDDSNTWTEEDKQDIESFSLQYAASIFSEDFKFR